MITVQELINHIEQKITVWRNEERKNSKVRCQLKKGKELISFYNEEMKKCIIMQIGNYKNQYEEGVIKINDYFQAQIQRQRKCYEREIHQLRSQIQRQYKVISNMRQEVQDLQELILMQNTKKQPTHQQEQKKQTENISKHEQGSKNNQIQKMATVYGLEVIEEQTQRTVVSSVKSFHEQIFSHHENFMRIEQKPSQEYSESDIISNKKCSSIQVKDSHQTDSIYSNSQFLKIQQSEQASHDKNSVYKLDQIMNSSNASKRQNTYQFDENSEEAFQKYESLPLTIDGYITKQFKQQQYSNDTKNSEIKYHGSELRQITNEKHCSSEQQRSEKTKMFLQQFRKTFNKCLSSATISRKQSGKTQKSFKKSKSRQEKKKTSREKLHHTANKIEADNGQKYLHEVLKETYNDNKFCVGNRRTQLKYEGEKKGNIKHGNGILTYTNGLAYEGEFKNNMRNGFGVLRFNQIEIYRGQWQDDQLSGQGKIRNFAVINKSKTQGNPSPLLKWISYCGYFKNNRFQGEGTLYLQGAEKFLGKFICGTACGEGTLYKKNGEIQTGIWRNNQLAQQF